MIDIIKELKLYVAFILVFLIGCKNPQKQETASVIKNQEISNTLPKSKKYSSIENLKLAFSKKENQLFLTEFPKDFEQFVHYFGWDHKNDEPKKLALSLKLNFLMVGLMRPTIILRLQIINGC